MKKINVLQLVEGFSFGGAEKKLLELVQRLNSNKYKVIVCSLGLGGKLQEEFEKIGIKVIVLARKFKFDFLLVFQLISLMKKEKIDILQTTLFYADFIGPIAARVAKVPVVFCWETISAPEWLVKRRLIGYKFSVKFVDKIICVSEATKKFSVEKRGISAAKLITIPYGVDLAKYRLDKNSKKKTDLALKANDIVVGTVARLHPQKGHQYLITAAAEVVERYPNVRFVFVGDGILRAELERLVDNLKLKDKILFLGFRHDVDELLHTFDIFVLPSLYEGLPNVVLEAMACGKPVIATAVDGSPEAITDGVSGILVPPKDSDALSKAILHLLENKKMRVEMGKKSRKKVTDYFSLEKQMQQFQILYDHHLQQKM